MVSGPVAFPKVKVFKTDSISAGVKVNIDKFDFVLYLAGSFLKRPTP